MGISNGRLRCAACGHTYRVDNGVFYLSSQCEERRSSDGGPVWSVEKFKNMFPEEDYYKSHTEWLQRRSNLSRRVARVVGEYENSLIKGRFLRWLNPSRGNVIIDVGCGVGFFIFDILSQYCDEDLILIGVDVLPRCAEWLSYRKYKENAYNVLPVVADAEHLPFRDNSADIVTCSEVLEHIFVPMDAVREMGRILKDEGRCFLSTPNKRGFKFWERATVVSRGLRRLFKIRMPSEDFYDEPLEAEVLKDYLGSAGFRIKSFEFNVKVLSRKIARFLPSFLAIKLINFFEKKLDGRRFGMHMVIECEKDAETG